MTIERRLRQHFDAARGDLTEPEPALQRVVQRGRRRRNVQTGAVAAGTLSLAVVAVLGVQGLTRSKVEFVPAAPPPAASDSPGASEAPTPQATPTSTPTGAAQPSPTPSAGKTEAPAPEVRTVSVRRLGETVLAYEPRHAGVLLIDSSGDDVTWPDPVVAAFPDGRGGFVVQASSGEVIWLPLDGPDVRLPNVADPDRPDSTGVELRGVDPDGSVIFSTRPKKRYDENILERFFTVALDPADAPELLADEGAHEAWYEGPAAVPDGRVIASCHLLCSLWRWPGNFAKPLYNKQTSIEGLTSTPDRTLLAFVESDKVLDDDAAVELVVLDATTFDERLRLSLPAVEGTPIGGAVVTLSSDGQRILVSVDAPATAKIPVPRTTFLVDNALTAEPVVRKVDFSGVVRWLDPGTVQKK